MAILDQLTFAATLTAAIGSGVIGGVFFAFSVFIMRALARLPSAEGIAAMQAINVTVLNPLFIGTFVGTAAVGGASVLFTLMRWGDAPFLCRLLGTMLYAVGTFGVTVAFNVPRNEALAAITPTAPEAEDHWRRYLREWTAWNHVRTVAALTAAVSFTLALAS